MDTNLIYANNLQNSDMPRQLNQLAPADHLTRKYKENTSLNNPSEYH